MPAGENEGSDDLPHLRRRHSVHAGDLASAVTRFELEEFERRLLARIERDRAQQIEVSELRHEKIFRDLISGHMDKDDIERLARDIDRNGEYISGSEIDRRDGLIFIAAQTEDRQRWSNVAEGNPSAKSAEPGEYERELRADLTWARRERRLAEDQQKERDRRARENAAKGPIERLVEGAGWLKQLLGLIAAGATVYALARYGIIPKP